MGVSASRAAAQGTVSVWEIPHNTPLYPGTQVSSGTPGLAPGPDGNIWFSQIFPDEGRYPSRVGRISPSGTFQRPYTTGNDLVEFLTRGPDGNVWFSEHFGSPAASVGKITAAGRVTRFPICGLPNCGLGKLAAGPDGNLWVPSADGLIYRVTPTGQVTGFPVPYPSARPIAITSGPDGNMWFTDTARDAVGRITLSGVVTEFPVVSPPGLPDPHGLLQLIHITSFAGDLWVDAGSPGFGFDGFIGRINTQGHLVATYLGTDCCAAPADVAVGPDGVYVPLCCQPLSIDRISANGAVTTYGTPLQYGGTITEGADRNMWFEGSKYDARKNMSSFFIGRLTTGG